MFDETDVGLVRRIHGSQRPLLVDVWADWCVPCRALHPILLKLEQEHPEIEFVRVEADTNPATLERYDIRSIPTLLLIKNGQVVGTRVGSATESTLVEWLATLVE